MELKKQNSNSSNKINIMDETQTKNIFESLTEGWDKDYNQDETHPYIKEIIFQENENEDNTKINIILKYNESTNKLEKTQEDVEIENLAKNPKKLNTKRRKIY